MYNLQLNSEDFLQYIYIATKTVFSHSPVGLLKDRMFNLTYAKLTDFQLISLPPNVLGLTAVTLSILNPIYSFVPLPSLPV